MVHGIDVQVVFPAGMFKFPCVVVLKLFGIFWNEEEFVEQAIKARHPLSLDSAVPQQLLDALKFTVSNDEATIARATVNFFLQSGPSVQYNWIKRRRHSNPKCIRMWPML